MRSVASGIASNLTARQSRVARVLYWVSGDGFSGGFWEGLEDRGFLIDGQARTYRGGALSLIPRLVAEVGLVVRNHRATLNLLQPGVAALVRDNDLEGADVEVRIAYFDPVADTLLGTVVDMVGQVSTVDLIDPPDGGTADCEITFTSAAVNLDRGLALRKSDSALQARHPGDRFRRYNTVSGKVSVAWGEMTQAQTEVRQEQREAQAQAARDSLAAASTWGP